MCAVILTLQEYYGGRAYFDAGHPPLARPHGRASTRKPSSSPSSTSSTASAGGPSRASSGTSSPFAVWKLCFREDSLLDMGLRTRGFLKHAWIYGLFLAHRAARCCSSCRASRTSARTTRSTRSSSRSWYDFLCWEAMYFAQFFGLEMFFRGFWLGALRRSFGSGAIFAMAVPYCMIHFGKPFLEANGAIVAGIALGSLSMRTKSIYQGFLVHITVAALMDWLSLSHRHALPTVFWPPG